MLNGGKSLKCLLLFSSVGRCSAAHAIQRRRVESTTTKNKCSLTPGAAQLEIIGVLQDNQDKSHQSTGKGGSMETGDKDMGLGVLYIILTLSHTAAYHILFVIFSKLFTSRNFTNRGGKVVSKFYHTREKLLLKWKCKRKKLKRNFTIFQKLFTLRSFTKGEIFHIKVLYHKTANWSQEGEDCFLIFTKLFTLSVTSQREWKFVSKGYHMTEKWIFYNF